MKTLGVLQSLDEKGTYQILFRGTPYDFSVIEEPGKLTVSIQNNLSRSAPLFVKLLKVCFTKSLHVYYVENVRPIAIMVTFIWKMAIFTSMMDALIVLNAII